MLGVGHGAPVQMEGEPSWWPHIEGALLLPLPCLAAAAAAMDAIRLSSWRLMLERERKKSNRVESEQRLGIVYDLDGFPPWSAPARDFFKD